MFVRFNLDLRDGGFTIQDFKLEFSKKNSSIGILEYFDDVISELKNKAALEIKEFIRIPGMVLIAT